MKRQQNVLKKVGWRWYENNKRITEKNLIFVYSSQDKAHIVSGLTGQKYYYSQIIFS